MILLLLVFGISHNWFTTNHVLALTNVVLAAATIATAVAAVLAIRASNRVAESADSQAKSSALQAASSDRQAKATDETVKAAVAQLEQGTAQLELGRQQLEKERQALAVSIRPIIVDVPKPIVEATFSLNNTEAEFRVPVRNIGRGAAFVHSALITLGVGAVEEAAASEQVVPADESTFIVRRFLAGHAFFGIAAELAQQGDFEFAVGIKYSDIAGEQRTQSNVRVAVSNYDCAVRVVELYDCDQNWIRNSDPIVQTGAQ